MYLAHHLLSLAHEYRDRLPPHLQKHNVTYADLTSVLRSVGSECFLGHMKYQRNIILDILRESGELSRVHEVLFSKLFRFRHIHIKFLIQQDCRNWVKHLNYLRVRNARCDNA